MTRQWRILHTESSRGWGGQEIRVFAELDWLRAHGHWVALAAHPDSKIAARAREAGLTFFPLRTHKAALPFAVAELAGWIVRHRIDVVNTHSSNDGWVAGLAARLTGRVLVRSRHIEVDYPNRFWSGIAYRTLPHHVITTSRRIADRLSRELGIRPSRITCIPTGIDLVRFRPGAVGTLRVDLGLQPDVPMVGMISVLRSWKGHATFLDAAARMIEAQWGIRFIIAGDGPGRDELAAKIAQPPWRNRVTMLGHRDDVANVLASLDVLVLPSFAHEGVPQIILQAQACGRPVVASNIGGIPEVVEDGVTGLLMEPRNDQDLAIKIARLLDEPELRQRLVTKARENVEQHHSLDAMGARLLVLYESLAGK